MFIIVPNCPISEFKFYDEGFENWKRLCKVIKNIKNLKKGYRKRKRDRQRDREKGTEKDRETETEVVR